VAQNFLKGFYTWVINSTLVVQTIDHMEVNRRTLLKQLAVISAAVALAPAIVGCESPPSTLFKNIDLNQDQEGLLRLIAQTIIPNATTPEGKEVSTFEYSAKMIDDCLSKTDQQKWLAGFTQFIEVIKKNDFEDNEVIDQLKFLTELDESKDDSDINFFFKTMKRFTIRGYTTSEYFMTTLQDYKIIPGKYKGCVPVTTA
jgi:hypothetical protein